MRQTGAQNRLPSRGAVYRRTDNDPSAVGHLPQRQFGKIARRESEEETKMTNAVIPLAKMPPPDLSLRSSPIADVPSPLSIHATCRPSGENDGVRRRRLSRPGG